MNRPAKTRFSVEILEPRELLSAPYESLPILPIDDPSTLDNARLITARAAALGKRADVFLKIGDSNSADPAYLAPLGVGDYDPIATGLAALRPDLLDTLAVYRSPDSTGINSFSRRGRVRLGGYLPELLPNLDQEIGGSNPGIALIMVGTNDMGIYHDPEHFRGYLTLLVDQLTSQGILPVLSTIPPNHFPEGPGLVQSFNTVIAETAEQRGVPLWNAWRILVALPGQGLVADGLHLNHSPRGGGSFRPDDLAYAQNVRNLQALEILDWYRERVLGPPDSPPSNAEWTPLPAEQSVFAAGRDVGQGPSVAVYARSDGSMLNRFLAYDSFFTGGVRVATADVNGDGAADIVTAPGPGGGPHVKVFSGADGSLLAGFFAFEPSFTGGLTVAARDLNGDAKAEVIVGTGSGGGPAVAVYRGGDLAELRRFFAFEPAFRGGVNVAGANVAGAGPVIVAGAGVGGGPAVKLFRLDTLEEAAAYFAFDSNVRGGVSVAASDLDGDGLDELAIAPARGAPHVRVIDPESGGEKASYFAGNVTNSAGLRLAVRPGTGNEPGAVLAASGPGDSTSVRRYRGLTDQFESLLPGEANRAYGVFVG